MLSCFKLFLSSNDFLKILLFVNFFSESLTYVSKHSESPLCHSSPWGFEWESKTWSWQKLLIMFATRCLFSQLIRLLLAGCFIRHSIQRLSFVTIKEGQDGFAARRVFACKFLHVGWQSLMENFYYFFLEDFHIHSEWSIKATSNIFAAGNWKSVVQERVKVNFSGDRLSFSSCVIRGHCIFIFLLSETGLRH